ncbi:15567_t:CDS:2 [Rhizophagus irregularis]|nr:15567_t:CDS:2 [Rhizophagus irregularis]
MTDPYMKARQGYDPQFTPGGWVTYQGQDSQRILKSSPRRILNQVK